jgi:hypothetical protein
VQFLQLTKGQAAVRDWFRTRHDRTGNCLYFRESSMTRWLRSFATERAASASLSWRAGGCPVSRKFGGALITNIRNVGSPHWRWWLGKQNRCIVLAT